MLAEEQIIRRHRARGAGFADVVEVHATAFDVSVPVGTSGSVANQSARSPS
jgi:hypothetical protein